ncbi:XdhC family protein (plasmid) [Sphaerotilus natans]|uniref:XdhC family protein n=1 Tax=Sphaerotilus natans TaxID=34103 RepID=UPI00406C8FC0
MDELDTQVLRTALAWQAAGTSPVLVTVARTWGSAPRPPGSLMVIDGRGRTWGSVSGGCIEDDLVARVREGGLAAVCARGTPEVQRYGISAEEAHRFGLPCGGTIELVLEPVSERSRLAELLAALDARRSVERRLDLARGEVRLSEGRPDGVPVLDEATLTSWHGPSARLILIGAGDIADFIGRMAPALGFEVWVCDPREERRAAWQLPGVTLSAEMPDDLIQRLKPDRRTAVVALSHDPKLDDLALIDALQSEAFYVGAIGSRRNSETRRARLREHFDLGEAALDRLHGPAGLYIGSRTPAEIALSILAEVVAAKNGARLPAGAGVAGGKAQAEATVSRT